MKRTTSYTFNTCKKCLFYLLFILSGLLFVPCTVIKAQGNLLLFPKRVVFEDGKKTENVNLTNIGKDTATYKISFTQIRMDENGKFVNIAVPDSNQLFADEYIRYYPRVVTLAPNESQIIKLQLKKSNGLAPGEYRSHLYFRAEKTPDPLGTNSVQTDTGKVSVKITALFGISIPTIIRVGKSTTKVSISDLSFVRTNDSIPQLRMVFNRSGNMSTYGNIIVNYIAPDGKITKVAQANGFALYTPGKLRKTILNLQEPSGVDYSKGRLTVSYTTPPEAKNLRLAEAGLTLSQSVSIR